jgi:hypothetical protein
MISYVTDWILIAMLSAGLISGIVVIVFLMYSFALYHHSVGFVRDRLKNFLIF